MLDRSGLGAALAALPGPEGARLGLLADYLVEKSEWIVGGDAYAYDIAFGGLDHVLSMHQDLNILILGTEVYSNTGGQASKATPFYPRSRISRGVSTGHERANYMLMLQSWRPT